MEFIEEEGGDFDGYASAVSYGYDVPLHLYSVTETGEDGLPRQLNPSSLFSGMGGRSSGGGMGFYAVDVWEEMIDNASLMAEQYDLIAGEWPDEWNEVVLVVDGQNRINDLYLYSITSPLNSASYFSLSCISSARACSAASTSSSTCLAA